LCLLACSVVAGMTGTQGGSVKEDYKTLQSPQGFWVKDKGEGKTQLHFKAKAFPEFVVTVTELVLDGKGFAPAGSFKVDAALQEKGGKNVLVINGKDIGYSFEGDQGFLVLKGEFEHQKKVINLTGKWGKTGSKK
jgi:hypothetical protein